jgi:PAS domain S-box-containing protein
LSLSRNSPERPALARYVLAILAVAVAVLACLLFGSLGAGAPLLLFLPAVTIAAWYGGPGPGLLATVLSALAAGCFFLSSRDAPALPQARVAFQLVLFGGVCALIAALSRSLLQARRSAETAARESRRGEEELRRLQGQAWEGEERFRTIANSTRVMIWMAGPDKLRDWFNQPWLDFTGRTMEQELGYGWAEDLHPDDLERFLAVYDSSFDLRREFSIEYRLRRCDGEFRWILAHGVPRLDAKGGFEGFVGSCIDIDDRKRAEEELHRLLEAQRQDREELEVMNRIGRILVVELDRDRLAQALTDEATQVLRAEFGSFFYNVVEAGQESYTLYTLSGVPREAFEGFPMPRNTEVFGPTFRGEGIVRSDDITRDPRYGHNRPYHGMPKGHLPVHSYLAAPVVSRSGEVLGGLFFGHSETGVFTAREERVLAGIAVQAAVALDNAALFRQTQTAREQAEAANRSKDEFLATVSHELRTPLNAILGWTQLLFATGDDPERRRKGLETIVRNAKLQAQLIDDLLDVSRIISGKMRLDVQTTDLAAVIDAAVEAIRPAAEAKQIQLRRVLDPFTGPVTGDPARLQQVVWNLLSNAIKFTPKEGKVEVRLERVNSHVEIPVADTGSGISPELLPYVFDRFRQLDGSTTRRHGGLGLGLAIVRHLVELHGGTVRVKSPGEGQGSTFIVALPLSVAHLTSAEGQRVHPRTDPGETDPCQQSPELNLKGIRVLVVDDEPDARETLQQILEHCDGEVRVADSAAEALRMLEDWRPDVLLSDIGMPGEDGYELIRRVRQLPPERGGRTPAAALTAFARAEDRRRALLAGFQMHVAKPVDIQELAAVVASLARGVAYFTRAPFSS